MSKKEIAEKLREITKELFILMFELMREDYKEEKETDKDKTSLPKTTDRDKLNKLN